VAHGSSHDVELSPNPRPRPAQDRERVLVAPEFGRDLTDHMVTMHHRDGTWSPLRLEPLAPLELSPATLALHYGQSVFEALKAYPTDEGPVLFRPDRNAERFAASAARLAMPTLPDGVFELSCALLAAADRAWIPTAEGAALYLRPFLFASEAHLSVRPAREYQYVVVASPAASYFGPELRAITVAVERSEVRAAPGGTGAVKFAGNYAAGFAAHGRAGRRGYDQVLWLDAVEHRWVEELNAMNVMFVWERGGRTVLTTPPTGGTILDGVTRASLLELAAEVPEVDEVLEAPTSIDDLHAGAADGTLREAFACGTAAVIAPIGRLVDGDRVLQLGDGGPGPVTLALRRALLDVQYGRRPDPDGWLVPVDRALERVGIDPNRLGPTR
jgi:branched-chain amino acid aminotransferase